MRLRQDLPLNAAIAVAAFAATVGLLAANGGDFDALDVLLAALASLPLALRRLWPPLLVFVLTAAASTALYAIAEPNGPPIGPTVALYWLASAGDESRERSRRNLAIVVLLLAAHVTAGGLARGAFPGTELVFGILLWGGTWLAGDRARLRRERIAALEDRALRAERETERERRLAAAEERARIARDLHDSAGHAMNVILVHAASGRLQSERDPDSARGAFKTIEEIARETVGEIDGMVRALREDGSTESTGEVEPPPGLAALDGLVERHRTAGIDVTTTMRGDRRPLPPGVDRAAYRILQEALTNAARHGDGSAQVELAFLPNALEVTVANPVSRGQAARVTRNGHGVIGMRERASLLGGSLEAGARNGGFRVHARLPLAQGPA